MKQKISTSTSDLMDRMEPTIIVIQAKTNGNTEKPNKPLIPTGILIGRESVGNLLSK